MPFNFLNNAEFNATLQNSYDITTQPNLDRLEQLMFNPFKLNDINASTTGIDDNIDPDLNFFDQADIHNASTCEYYLPDDFKNIKPNQELKFNNLSILHQNIRSLKNKYDDFTQFLNNLPFQFTVIGLTETWIKNETMADDMSIPGYNLECINRENKLGGGVCLYIKEGIHYKIRNDINTNIDNTIESLFIEIASDKSKNTIIGVIYRPPSNNFDKFQESINSIIENINKENKMCYLLGDFNIDLLKSNANNISS